MPRFGPAFADRPVLAVGETKFFGEPVAAVAAETRMRPSGPRRAREQVEYEELPAVLTVEQALDPASPLVQDPAMRPGETARRTRTSFGSGRSAGAT